MDIPRVYYEYGATPEYTPNLSNESGYITATPSPLCTDSPERERAEFLTIHRPGNHILGETPITSQKSFKVNSFRKHLLQEDSVNCQVNQLSNNVPCSSDLCCSCSMGFHRSFNVQSAPKQENGALAECFSHLLVCERSISDKVLCDKKEMIVSIHSNFQSDKKINSSKNKSHNYEDQINTKKFKQDLDFISLHKRTVSSLKFRNSYLDVSHLDILVHLSGISGCFPGIISQILSYLAPQDLVTMCFVSSKWRQVCVDDPSANRKRLAYLQHVRHAKENVILNQSKQSRQSSSVNVSSKAVFREIQNTERRNSSVSPPPKSPRSPPVSPSKVRFNLFVKAGVALDEGTRLIRCPRCSHPSQASSENAHCQAVGCQYNFCVSCLCDIHEGQQCPGRRILPVRRKTSSIGSKESRRNLRRL